MDLQVLFTAGIFLLAFLSLLSVIVKVLMDSKFDKLDAKFEKNFNTLVQLIQNKNANAPQKEAAS